MRAILNGLGLRPARIDDFAFVEAVFFDASEPRMRELGIWNERKQAARLRRLFKLEEVRIITVSGSDVGWMQVSESEVAIDLHQLHIRPDYRSLGIGTKLISDLIDRARTRHLPVTLRVYCNNPAVALYERLGFTIVGRDRHRLKMRWQSPAPTTRV